MSKLNLYTNERLAALREVKDPLADQAIRSIVEDPSIASEINEWKVIPIVFPEHFPPEVADFFSFYHSQPNNLDEKKIQIAQKFFSSNGNTYLGLLGFYSLPYCYAFADGAQVLVRSKRIIENQGRRLLETAGFVLECFRPGTFLRSNSALLVLAKVRLIHAISRYFIEMHDTTWKEEWGRPINQEDMIGTNLAFSYLVVRGFRKVNQPVNAPIVDALLHYWEVIGFYMGLDISYWPTNVQEAIYMEKLIRQRHMKSSDAGIILINSLISHYKTTGEAPLVNFIESIIAYFIGSQAADCLDLQQKYNLPPSLFASVLGINFKSIGKNAPSFAKLESEFHKIVKQETGSDATIKIPVLPKGRTFAKAPDN